jgi:16S rRNA (cytosine1402-N4)-methyltransferase
MAAPHVPVLRDEVVRILQPAPGRRIVDGTYGFGGHAAVCLAEGAEVLGLDLDGEAVAACQRASARRPRLHCRQASFQEIPSLLGRLSWPPVDGVLLDLGVSSRQLDDPAFGFTYRQDAPLDLRFARERGEPAWSLLARLQERELADLLFRFGEEPRARQLARAIVAAGRGHPLRTTGQLRAAIESALPSRVRVPAVLSRCFQALRIAVNDELETLQRALANMPDCLREGGRLVVISYHSLEDRLVKRWLAHESRDCVCPPEVVVCQCGHRRRLKLLTRRPLRPSPEEVARNPRARSARLRAAEMLAPAGRSTS